MFLLHLVLAISTYVHGFSSDHSAVFHPCFMLKNPSKSPLFHHDSEIYDFPLSKKRSNKLSFSGAKYVPAKNGAPSDSSVIFKELCKTGHSTDHSSYTIPITGRSVHRIGHFLYTAPLRGQGDSFKIEVLGARHGEVPFFGGEKSWGFFVHLDMWPSGLKA